MLKRNRAGVIMSIAVFGSSGFIGKTVTSYLTADGEDIFLFDKESSSINYKNKSRIKYFKGDVTHSREVKKIFDLTGQIDKVVYLISVLGDIYKQDPLKTICVNINGLKNVLKFIKNYGVSRFIYCSSIAVYGSFSGTGGITESSPCTPDKLYGVSKLLAEYLVKSYCSNKGIEYTSLRLGHVFGPARRNGNKVINNIIEKALSGSLQWIPHGEQTYDLVYVKDCAKAFSLILNTKRKLPDALNVGGGKLTMIKEVVSTVNKVIPGSKLRCKSGLDSSRPVRDAMNIDQISSLGWFPEHSLEQAIKNIII